MSVFKDNAPDRIPLDMDSTVRYIAEDQSMQTVNHEHKDVQRQEAGEASLPPPE